MFRLTDQVVFRSLLFVRLVSAVCNIIHDCDEVYNYWEPLHRLLYGYGKQPWEYSPEFALRSYLYILLHWVLVYPIRIFVDEGQGKKFVFYGLKCMFAILSAFLESTLHKKVKNIIPETSRSFFLFLTFNPGLSFAASTFLPSSFSMFCLAAATICLLDKNLTNLIACSVVGVVLGWTVSGVAFLPFALHVLVQPELSRSFRTLFFTLFGVLVPFVFADWYFYGKITVSLWNFVKYNVIGGGQSALYGVEPLSYYVKNGLLNFSLVFILVGCLPILGALTRSLEGQAKDQKKRLQRIQTERLLWIACSPIFAWTFAISCLPHKEERFLYVVYPHICLAASLSLVLVSRLFDSPRFKKTGLRNLLSPAKLMIFILYIVLSVMRIGAIWMNLSAPMQIYNYLPSLKADLKEKTVVCIGDEWHRFPSSFFLPSPSYRLGFLKQNFSGLLPADFSEQHLGTRSTENRYNDLNQPEPSTYVSPESCQFLIDFDTRSAESLLGSIVSSIGWKRVAQLKILDRKNSPGITRILYVPLLNEKKNSFGTYTLYKHEI